MCFIAALREANKGTGNAFTQRREREMSYLILSISRSVALYLRINNLFVGKFFSIRETRNTLRLTETVRPTLRAAR